MKEKKKETVSLTMFFSVSNMFSPFDMYTRVCVCVYDKRINVPCDVRAWMKKKEKERKKKRKKGNDDDV